MNLKIWYQKAAAGRSSVFQNDTILPTGQGRSIFILIPNDSGNLAAWLADQLSFDTKIVGAALLLDKENMYTY